MDRGTAEQEYGFSIYQGHGVPSSTMRIVRISDRDGKLIDAEACGGLHLMGRETYIGLIKITASYRIHDGINRIEFVAGPAAADYISAVSKEISSIGTALKYSGSSISQGVMSCISELESYKKQYESMEEDLSKLMGAELSGKSTSGLVSDKTPYGRKLMRKAATIATAKNPRITVILHNDSGEIIAISGQKSGISAIDVLREYVSKNMKGGSFSGGGSDKFAEGVVKFS
jgi:alanyl-tRNA synthetase